MNKAQVLSPDRNGSCWVRLLDLGTHFPLAGINLAIKLGQSHNPCFLRGCIGCPRGKLINKWYGE